MLFLSCSTYAQELNGVAEKFLQRHGVPCLFVLKVGSPGDMEEVATCQDKREWALFWLEGEIAFVHPQTRDPTSGIARSTCPTRKYILVRTQVTKARSSGMTHSQASLPAIET